MEGQAVAVSASEAIEPLLRVFQRTSSVCSRS